MYKKDATSVCVNRIETLAYYGVGKAANISNNSRILSKWYNLL